MDYEIDWEEVSYLVTRMQLGKLSSKTLTQRIYRETCKNSKLTLKVAQFIYGMENKDAN